ncbi:STY4851/ECs_5259 family protein [Aminobacter carboxidus]|uniref:Uncharacterized protein n=1 Tax=Aminobacter carboxidus TaxID=376165 RepID=A0ABR9GJ37_9HYPH|nr:STY4851/ECs_5259 family protein [Aminobacter carboxidus]MBE1203682.1 hypothetical protein [Aminobacter carboxidus]
MGGEYSDLSSLLDEQLAEMFQQRRDDLQFLEILNQELKSRTSDDALELQIEVVTLRRAARTSGCARMASKPLSSGPVREWLRAYLGARGLPQPNGEPLYRYRMVDAEYGAAKRILHELSSSGRLVTPDRRAGALFVAFCAEWFRRESESTFLRWNELAPDIFPSVPYPSKQELTLLGLGYWRRELRTSDNAREFLLTLALEGGFPVRILTENERGWLKFYLRTIMRRAITHRLDTHQDILAIADEERGRMRKSYQRDDFIELCAELAARLIQLRREAEDIGGGKIANSAVLDVKHPGWLDELPLYVAAKDSGLVSGLLTDLLDEKLSGLATEGVEARRFLVKQDGQWRPAVQILADGEVSVSRLTAPSMGARLRAIPSGELGKHYGGELALLEPPIGEQRRWRIHPSSRVARLLVDYPFVAPVTVSLTAPEGAPTLWTWPRGDALRSDVLVFQEDEGSTPDRTILRFIRAGSVSSPAKTLHVLVPRDWTVEAGSEGVIAEIEDVPTIACKLIRLSGTAYFRANEHESVRFRIEPNTDSREQELELTTMAGPGFELADGRFELALSPVAPMIREERGKTRQPRPGELFQRRPGGKWQPLNGALRGLGLFELSWRDPEAGIQIEKRLLSLIPENAAIRGAMTAMQAGEIRLNNLPGWKVSSGDPCREMHEIEPGRLTIQFPGRPIYRLPLTLQPPGGPAFDIVVPLAGREAGIVLADGGVIQPGTRIDLSQLRGAIAIAPRQTTLQVAPKGSRSGFKKEIDGELPLGILRAAISETLATLPNQDDLVELDFLGDFRLPIRVSRYRYEQLSIIDGKVSWTSHNGAGVRLVGRMLLKPAYEHELELDVFGLWRLPERCFGPCLVYLREGIDVVSRPAPLSRTSQAGLSSRGLAACISISDYEERRQALVIALRHCGQGKDETEDLEWLLDAALNLNGLPASAFDALKLLPEVPEAALRLLVSARDEGDRSVIWALQDELPFLWMGLPLKSWATVFHAEYAAVQEALEPVLGAQKAAGAALGRLTSLRDGLLALEPALISIFARIGLPSAVSPGRPSLKELTSSYVAAQFHRGSEMPNDIASSLASRGIRIHEDIASKSHESFAGLFAPALLALGVHEKFSVDREQSLIVRQALRSDPAYVAGAWSHFLDYYS